jgi:hypothetical protein
MLHLFLTHPSHPTPVPQTHPSSSQFCHSSDIILKLLKSASECKAQNMNPYLIALDAAVKTVKPDENSPLFDTYQGLVSSVGKLVTEIRLKHLALAAAAN